MIYDIVSKEQNISGDWSVVLTIKDSNGKPTNTFSRLFDYEPTNALLTNAVTAFLQEELERQEEENDPDND